MREYELEIDEAFNNGLGSDYYMKNNIQLLYKCLGFRCGRLGLEPYKFLDNPLPETINLYYSWPFPQVLVGEKFNIVVVRDEFAEEDVVYEMSDNHDVASYISTIDTLTFGQGNLMEIADFGEYIVMTNGVVMIYRDIDASAWVMVQSHADYPLMETMCNFKGQLVGGGVLTDWHGCDEKFYIWSRVGSMDCLPDLTNEAGYRRCPYGGVVKNVRRLSNKIVGCSDKGITLLSPVNSPMVTFGFTEVYDKGIINKGAIDGSLNGLVFIDEDYNIVRISSDYSVNPIGYQRYIKELIGSDIIVNYDRIKGDYYIGNDVKTFLLSSKGLTEIQQHPSAIWAKDKVTYTLPDTVDDIDPEINTEVFNMEYSGQKTISSIESDAIGHTDAQAGVDYLNELGEWEVGDFTPINSMGNASVVASANMFRFKLKFDTVLNNFRLGLMNIRYKMTDLRGIRGVYAPPLRGQK